MTWKEQQRALTRRARMGKVVKQNVTAWRDSSGTTYERLPSGQIINKDKQAKRRVQADSQTNTQ